MPKHSPNPDQAFSDDDASRSRSSATGVSRRNRRLLADSAAQAARAALRVAVTGKGAVRTVAASAKKLMVRAFEDMWEGYEVRGGSSSCVPYRTGLLKGFHTQELLDHKA